MTAETQEETAGATGIDQKPKVTVDIGTGPKLKPTLKLTPQTASTSR